LIDKNLEIWRMIGYNEHVMALAYTELKKGLIVVIDNAPCEILEASFLRMQQRKAVVQTKYRNLITGKVLEHNWQASDYFEEADVEKKDAQFIYAHRDEYWFTQPGNPKNRFSLSQETIGEAAQFLKPNTLVGTLLYNGKVIQVKLPIKMDFKVKEAPPAIRGNTAQGGSKVVTLENGAQIATPLFIEEGEVIRVNTETGQYVERVK
jgi:elongation factor P